MRKAVNWESRQNILWVRSASFWEVMTVLSQHGLKRQGALVDIGFKDNLFNFGCKLESLEGFLKILLPRPHPRPHPRPIKSASVGVVPRHQWTSMCHRGWEQSLQRNPSQTWTCKFCGWVFCENADLKMLSEKEWYFISPRMWKANKLINRKK